MDLKVSHHLETSGPVHTGQEHVEIILTTSESNRLGRRRFFKQLGAAAAVGGAATVTGSLVGCSDGPAITLPSTTPTVLDILNFALNLEYLEASFYSYIATGNGLAAGNLGTTPGTVTGGAQVTFTNPVITKAAAQLAADEGEHVAFLRATITSVGGTPVSLPSLNLAAAGAVTDDASFLAVARQLENVGVSAYIGGAQYLTSSTAALTYAAQILHTEAQHAGFLRELCIVSGVQSPAADPLDHTPSSTQIFDVDPATGLTPSRTAAQVLQIVYAAPGSTGTNKGGFFPDGMNGNIVIT